MYRSQAAIRAYLKPFLKIFWCIFGATIALSAVFFFTGEPKETLLLASLGGTTVFLFGLTKSAAGQPRAIIGGHLGGAAIGIACGQFLGESAYSCVLAVALTLSWMLVTRTVHPPAGANPLIMIHAHANWIALLSPVIISIVVLMTVAMIWSRLIPGTIHYPHSIFEPSPPDSGWGPWKREFSEEVTDET